MCVYVCAKYKERGKHTAAEDFGNGGGGVVLLLQPTIMFYFLYVGISIIITSIALVCISKLFVQGIIIIIIIVVGGPCPHQANVTFNAASGWLLLCIGVSGGSSPQNETSRPLLIEGSFHISRKSRMPPSKWHNTQCRPCP